MKKGFILLTALLLITGILWIAQNIELNQQVPDSKYIIRNQEISVYDQFYQDVSDQLHKEGIPKNYTLDILQDGGDIFSVVLAQDYQYRDIKLGCIVDQKQNAIQAAYHTYTAEKYGADFYQQAKQKANQLEQRYQLTHLDSLLTQLVKKAYTTHVIGDSLEIGICHKYLFDQLPVKLVIGRDKQLYSSYFSSQETEKQVIVKATYKSYINHPRYALPPISLRIYFDQAKINFPYAHIPVKTITLNNELDYNPMRDWQ